MLQGSCDRELGVLGGVAVLDSVVVFEERVAIGVDEDRAERVVTALQRLPSQFHTARQALDVLVAESHRIGVYALGAGVRRNGIRRALRVGLDRQPRTELCVFDVGGHPFAPVFTAGIAGQFGAQHLR